ncbi:MAG: ParB N-terminal domain-containing protein [Nitrososphaerales archaeon]
MIAEIPGKENLELDVLPLAKLVPHEDIIPSLRDSVVRDLERSGYQRDPILVDKKTNVVLDGMHRRAALQQVGARFAVCAIFDYFDEKIILERWIRHFLSPDRKMIDEMIDLFELKKTKDIDSAIRSVNDSSSPIALLSARQSYVSSGKYDVQSLYRKLGDFDRLARERKMEVEFHSEQEGPSLFASESVFVLYPLPFKKQDILNVASIGKTFPFKTTRHIVPLRPMGLYFPLDILKQTDLGMCKDKLEEIVKNSKIEVIPPSVWYEGRKYSEPISLFRHGPEEKN